MLKDVYWQRGRDLASLLLHKSRHDVTLLGLARAVCLSSRAKSTMSLYKEHRSVRSGQTMHSNLNRLASYTTCTPTPRRTPLYDLHLQYKATMVPFGGYLMPLQYAGLGHGQSHQWTRTNASLFDVSHMVQHRFEGLGAERLLSRLTPAGLSNLEEHRSTLSCLLHPGTGGIVDDTIITRLGPQSFYVVTNAGCREKDLAYFTKNIDIWQKEGGDDVKWIILENQGLIALQGPTAAKLLEPLFDHHEQCELDNIYFGQSKFLKLRLPDGKLSSAVLISRGGYTGEDGFEMSIAHDDIVPIVEQLLETSGPEQLRWAGLGARDSLRLEAGMCLYGHDLDDTTTPVEASLSWVIANERRVEGGFNGSDVILQQLKTKKSGGSGVDRRRVGLVVEGAPAREGAVIVNEAGDEIGNVTSGCPSPTLRKNIAMGYVKTGYQKPGTELYAVVRGKRRKAVVTKMPFVPSKYWKGGVAPG